MADSSQPPRPQRPSPQPTARGHVAHDTGHAAQNTSPPGSKPAPAVTLAAGSRPVPDYELVHLLGRGGFGEVWQARGPGDFDVALKFIRLGDQAGRVETRALELMKGIRHPHLLPMFGAWQAGDLLVIALELADGTLLDRLRAAHAQGQEGIPAEELLERLLEAAKGLDYLNDYRDPALPNMVGIQHKDVKPHNLLLVGGCVKVADFGLAKVLEHTVTAASSTMTPAYAAPEFLKGEATRWSDQYCLAVTYCQLRGSRLPFEGNHMQVMAGHLMNEPDLSMLPEAERPAVARALSKEPKERWPTCRAFAEALLAAGPARGRRSVPRGQPMPALPVTPKAPPRIPVPGSKTTRTKARPPSRPATRSVPPTPRTHAPTPPPGRKRLPLVVAGGAGCLLACTVAAVLLSRGPRPAGTPSDSLPQPAPVVRPALVSSADGGRTLTLDLGDGVTLELVRIPRGRFLMGSPDDDKEAFLQEKPQHEVEITKDFYLGKYEVTRGQFRRFVADTGYKTEAETDGWGGCGYDAETGKRKGPLFLSKSISGQRISGEKTTYSWRNPGFEQTDEHPVVNVSWNDAREFCRWLERRSGKLARLPTEAEWEYSCRAGTTTRYHSGDDGETLAEVGNVADGTARKKFPDRTDTIKAEDGYAFTAPVGKFKPNRFGLYDMHGNASEWCQDWYDWDRSNNRSKMDPQGRSTGTTRMLRGGAWSSDPRFCRAAKRMRGVPATRTYNIGFRIAFRLD